MTTESVTGPPHILQHDLDQYFSELLKFDSTPEMERSALYREIRPEVERILNSVAVDGHTRTPYEGGIRSGVHALAWNLERGIKLDGIIAALQNHADLINKDVLLLTELDHGMARSGNRFVAQDIA